MYTLVLFSYRQIRLNTPVCVYLAFLQLQIPLGMPVSVHPGFVQLHISLNTPVRVYTLVLSSYSQVPLGMPVGVHLGCSVVTDLLSIAKDVQYQGET